MFTISRRVCQTAREVVCVMSAGIAVRALYSFFAPRYDTRRRLGRTKRPPLTAVFPKDDGSFQAFLPFFSEIWSAPGLHRGHRWPG